MYDQASRSMWLEDQLWPALRDKFPIKSLSEHVLITVGYPSSGARGRSEKIKPAEINYQWQGNTNEQAFISVHPVYFDKPINVAKAILYQGAKVTSGARWGPRHVGLHKNDDGSISVTSAETQSKLDQILQDIGDPPAGFGVAFPVRTVQRARLRKYVASMASCSNVMVGGGYERHPIIRSASDTLSVKCQHCGTDYQLA